MQVLTDASSGRTCKWCGGPIPAGLRRDAVYCSTSHRQAAHRFSKGRAAVTLAEAGEPRRWCYADPPYPGKAGYYADHPDFAGEVDHRALVGRLVDEFPDGWALSTSSSALQEVLGLCPPGVRVASWVCGERPTKGYAPLASWEPVIVAGGRPVLRSAAERRVDSLVYASRARTTEGDRRVIGAKPATFCWWLFDLLGAQPIDELVDLFPGSGGVGRAWDLFVEGDPSRFTTVTDAVSGVARRVSTADAGLVSLFEPDPRAFVKIVGV